MKQLTSNASAPQASAVELSRPGEIYDELRDRIALLIYPPGTFLSENKLAAEFGVSRTPIRQVLQRLEFDGLVEIKHGVGTLVSPIDFEYLAQVYALRLKLLDLIAELSPPEVSDADLVILEELIAQARELADGEPRPAELSQLYTRFSGELMRAIGNRPLREITERLFYQTHRVWLQLLPTLKWSEEVGSVVEEFSTVYSALREGDMPRVAQVRRQHFGAVLQRINEHLKELELLPESSSLVNGLDRSRLTGPERR